MAKRGNSVIGIDLGRHAFKGVLLQRKNDSRYVLTSYASREVPEHIGTVDDLAQQLRLLIKDIGGSAKGCALAVWSPDSLLRIIEQPETPIDLLRNALRLNGLAVLNQECKDFVLDCAPVSNANTGVESNGSANGNGGTATQVAQTVTTQKYLVGGMLRPSVKHISEAATKAKITADILQLAPVCSFNAFELAYPETFANETFLLLDMGHVQSTVLIGSKKELVLVRSIDYGGRSLLQAMTAEGALDEKAARLLLHEGDPGMVDICRTSLSRLATEIRNSIGFFEGQREESIHRIFVSGGLARTETILQTLSDELSLPCEIWDPLESCEVALPPAKRQALPNEFVSLNVACGAAFEYLRNQALMALQLNLLHEQISEQRQRQRDPLKLGIMAIGALGALMLLFYVFKAYQTLQIKNRLGQVQNDWSKIEPKVTTAQNRAKELNATIDTTKVLDTIVEGRFFWAPLLQTLSRCVAPNAQLTSVEGSVSDDNKSVTLAIQGLAAGREPRAAAEELRQLLTEQLGQSYSEVKVEFKSLEDLDNIINVGGANMAIARYVMNVTLNPIAAADPGQADFTNPDATTMMKSIKLSKDQIQKLALSVIGFVILVYCYFAFFLGPLNRSRELAENIADLQTKLGSSKSEMLRASNLESKATSATARFASYKNLSPEGAPIAWFPPRVKLFFANQQIDKVTARLENSSPFKQPELAEWMRYNWAIELPQTDFVTIGKALAELENNEPLLVISKISLKAGTDDPQYQQVSLSASNAIMKR